MPSKLKLRNNLETELEIVHPDNRTAKSISSTDIAVDGRGYGTEDVGDVYADTIGAISGSIISTQFSWEF